MDTATKKIYTYEKDFNEFVRAINAKEACLIDEEMFYYWLEVLPPIYMNKKQLVDVDGVKYVKDCSFGFAEGREYIIDFWHTGDKGVYACKRSDRLSLGY